MIQETLEALIGYPLGLSFWLPAHQLTHIVLENKGLKCLILIVFLSCYLNLILVLRSMYSTILSDTASLLSSASSSKALK